MTHNFARIILLAFIGAVVAGCAKTDRNEATGKGFMVAVNAIVDAPDVQFRIEERTLGAIAFANATQANRYDDLNYTFNFDYSIAGASELTRLASRPLKIVRDTFYLFVLSGSLAAPEIIVWEDAIREWAGTESVFELAFANLSNELGPVDIYFDPAGTAPVLGNAVGSLAIGERIDTAEFAAGSYDLTLTAPDDPQTILYTSGTRSWTGASTDTLMIFDRDPSRTSTVTVRRVTQAGSATELADPRFPPAARFLHAAIDVGNVDIAPNNDFQNLVVADLAFDTLTDDTALVAGLNSYTYTEAGNQGGTIVEEETTVNPGYNYTLVLVGPAGDPDVLTIVSQRRPYATSGRLAFLQAAAAIDFLDIYLLEAGTSIDDSTAIYQFLPFKTAVVMSPIPANNYELTLTVAGEKTVIAGPVALDIVNGDVIDVFVHETVDPNVADVRVVRYP